MVFSWTEVKPHLAGTLSSFKNKQTWQTVSTSWKTKPSPVSSASLWTAPAAAPHWGMWHWVQAQDFQWLPLRWLKLDPCQTTGGYGSMLLLWTDVTCRNTLNASFWVTAQAMGLVWEQLLIWFHSCFGRSTICSVQMWREIGSVEIQKLRHAGKI